MSSIIESLPSIYQRFFPEMFTTDIPRETKADCANCSMCDATKSAEEGRRHFFSPDTKCCTYHPRIPNYLIGALLADDRPELAEGRRRIRAKIAARSGVTPQWLSAPAKYQFFYKNLSSVVFGKASAMRCPYYDEQGGGCTVWAVRDGVCSTWFCKYVAGAHGKRFWEALKIYLAQVELQLSRFALLKNQPEFLWDDAAPLPATGDTLSLDEFEERPVAPEIYAAAWRDYEGREEEFYVRCYETVATLDRDGFDRVMGIDGQIKLGHVERALAAVLRPKLPERLRFNPNATVTWLADGSVALGAYSEYEALALPGVAYELLVAFNGRSSVAEVRAKLRETKSADLDDDILLVLHQQQILI